VNAPSLRLLWIPVVLFSVGCHRGEVARVDGEKIMPADLARFAQRYGVASSANKADEASRKRATLDKLIDFEVVVQEGRRRGMDRDPLIQDIVKQQLFARVVREEVDAKATPASVSAEDVARYYSEHTADFGRPDEVRVSQIVVKDQGEAARLVGEARRARDRANPGKDLEEFRKLVARYSIHEPTKGRGGDMGFISHGSAAYPPAVVAAAESLRENGEVSDSIAAPDGYHILKRTELRPGSLRTMEQVRPLIQQIIARQRREKAMEELTARLRSQLGVTINEAELARTSLAPRPGGTAP
jgi:parvulin-like peptidyl-prolyl isomerase